MSLKNQNLLESLKDWADEALHSGAPVDKVFNELVGKLSDVSEAESIIRAVRHENNEILNNDEFHPNQ